MAKRKRRHAQTPQSGSPPSSGSRWSPALLLVVVPLAVCGVVVFWPGPTIEDSASTPQTAGGSSAIQNVLVITLDTTRADRLGCYGYSAAQTPALDALAQSGVRFDAAFCQVPLTLPSHGSLFAGRWPPAINIQVNGGGGLAEELPTLAEVFRTHGYRTGAFIAAVVLNSSFGLNQGFDVYDDSMTERQSGDKLIVAQRPADAVCDSALSWLDAESDKPFFAWVHFYDPHDPYEPPVEFAVRFDDPYDGEVAFVDSQIDRLLKWLGDKGLRDDTLIVVVGDHGEGLGDHGEMEHGLLLYNATMRVPLIMAAPGVMPEPRVVEAPVRLVDVFPTIVDLLGWVPPTDLDGRSLAHACRTGEVPTLPVYGETWYPRVTFGWAALRSLVADNWKYIQAPKPELYDWRSDPGEANNVAEQHPDTVKRLHDDLQALVSTMDTEKYAPADVELDAQTRRQLASLGYLESDSVPQEFDDGVDRRDPKDMMEAVVAFKQAREMVRIADLNSALNILEPLVRENPDAPTLKPWLAITYLGLRRMDEAMDLFRSKDTLRVKGQQLLCDVGSQLLELKSFEDAATSFEKALELGDEKAEAHCGLGMALFSLGQGSQAEPYLRRCVQENPESADYLAHLGAVLVMLKRPAEGVPLIEKAFEYDSANANAHKYLWQGLLGAGRRADALDRLEVAQALMPNELYLSLALAWLYATTPGTSPEKIDRAVTLAEQGCQSTSSHPGAFDTLAAARAAQGDFPGAIEAARRAIELAKASGDIQRKGFIEERLRLYESNQRYFDPDLGDGNEIAD
ncbi:MAG: sulfatase-like hydrolase/transferase [Phycisphaerales bacterium]|nr:MAG: sulfatase-like hydrolase/transferase [Phycisphaerales bacterium]